MSGRRVELEYKGRLMTYEQLAEMSELSKRGIMSRINQGWSVEDAVDTPLMSTRGKVSGVKVDKGVLTSKEVSSEIAKQKRLEEDRFRKNAEFARCAARR